MNERVKRQRFVCYENEKEIEIGKEIDVITNHFKITINKNVFYNYVLEIKTKLNDKRLIRLLKKYNNEVGYKIVSQIVEENQIEHFAFDGSNNFYTTKKLKTLNCNSTSFETNVSLNNLEIVLIVKIKLIAELDLQNIFQYFIKNDNQINLSNVIRALDIIFKHGPLLTGLQIDKFIFPKILLTSLNSAEFNSNSISKDDWIRKSYEVGICKRAVFGHFQSCRIMNKQINLIIDRSTSIFYEPQDLVTFLDKILRKNSNNITNFNTEKLDMINFLHLGKYNEIQENIDYLNSNLINLMIETTHLPQRKVYKIKEFSKKKIGDLKFYLKDIQKEIYIVDYFMQKYNTKLNKYWPCINIGAKYKPIYFPFEVCSIASNQQVKKLDFEEMKKQIQYSSFQQVDKRFELIEEKAKLIKEDGKDILDSFSVSLDTNPIKVKGIQLFNPLLNFNEKIIQPKYGKWNMDDKKVFEPINLKCDEWIVVNLCESLTYFKINLFLNHFLRKCVDFGIQYEQPIKWNDLIAANYENSNSIKNLLNQILCLQNKTPKLIFFLISKVKNDTIYKDIKGEAEVDFGLKTQCITEQTINCILKYYSEHIKKPDEKLCKKNNGDFILENLILKINTKLGGINCALNLQSNEISKLKDKLMIVGADVTHPSLNEKINFPFSVCSVVSSVDSNYFKYVSMVRIQDKSAKEIIEEMRLIMFQLLELVIEKKIQDFKQKINLNDQNQIFSLLPDHIIYYRDGVSEGQYKQLLDCEFENMKKAFDDFSLKYNLNEYYRPKVNIIVVLKRHNTRFKVQAKENFDLNKYQESLKIGKTSSLHQMHISTDDEENIDLNNLNIDPGTLVDSESIVKSNNEFYLCSHNCDQGTIRCTNYFILVQESINFKHNEIKKFTYDLCYLFGKGMKSISIPPPVKYAHLAAYRARNHLANKQYLWQTTNNKQNVYENNPSTSFTPNTYFSNPRKQNFLTPVQKTYPFQNKKSTQSYSSSAFKHQKLNTKNQQNTFPRVTEEIQNAIKVQDQLKLSFYFL